MKFEAWNTVNEAKRSLSEAEGVSRAVYGALKSFFDEHGKDASYDQAKAYVASKVKGWELSKEDFEEAKEMVKESLNEADDEKKDDEKKEKKDDKDDKEDEEWKKKFESFMKEEGKDIEKKATVFPEEVRSLVSSFMDKHKDLDATSEDVVGYAKELLGIEEAQIEEEK